MTSDPPIIITFLLYNICCSIYIIFVWDSAASRSPTHQNSLPVSRSWDPTPEPPLGITSGSDLLSFSYGPCNLYGLFVGETPSSNSGACSKKLFTAASVSSTSVPGSISVISTSIRGMRWRTVPLAPMANYKSSKYSSHLWFFSKYALIDVSIDLLRFSVGFDSRWYCGVFNVKFQNFVLILPLFYL